MNILPAYGQPSRHGGRLIIGLSILAAVTVLVSCNAGKKNYELRDGEARGIKVGVYLDHGVWDGTDAAIGRMLAGIKCAYTPLNKTAIENGELDGYSLLLMPGGDMWEYNDYLGPAAMNRIETFVANGGGFIGICGGAYFAAEKIVWMGWANEPRKNISIGGLNLFPGVAQGPIEDFAPSYRDGDSGVRIVDNKHPVAESLPGIIKPMYDHGPEFIPDGKIAVSILGKTVRGDKTVIMAFQHGSGRVFLTGSHPERDASCASWAIIKNAILWCVNK